MKNIFNILLLILCLHYISYSQDKSNVECGFFGTTTVEERNAIFPFSEAEMILLISYPNAEEYHLKRKDSVGLSEFGYKIEKEFVFHDSLKVKLYDATKIVELKSKTIKELSNLMFNYDYKTKANDTLLTISVVDCYTPRNAIIFLDKNEKVISVLEICFECIQYYLFPKSKEFKDVLGLECDKRLGYFRKMFDDYGFENYKNNKNITFQIFDNQGALRGASLISNNSKIVQTDFDGNAFVIMNNKTKKVELSYMGKPTLLKIIPNCDFIKVDLSKGKAFYYKDNKFIKSKKLIVE
ncbi:hypothetical protein [uncultured Flavobacterium sp.]|uniref:hypothetical protein n=1 Tax=uncultured Flavobacterium sp. TaxID=165435 RepID=UPI0030C8B916